MEGAPGPVTPVRDLLERYAIDDIVRAIDAGLPVFDAGRVLMTREGSFNLIRDLIDLEKKPAHKPSLRSVDEAIRRRFHLIPFAVTIPADERDPNLTEKLREERPGILAWLIQGCLEWQAKGLLPPPAVLDATAAYLEAEDAIAAWLDERCERAISDWTSLSALYASWSDWAAKAGEIAGSQKGLGEKLKTRGFTDHKRNVGKGFYGLRVRLHDPDDHGWEMQE
jgi:phage/plasmid-associated DNA primase